MISPAAFFEELIRENDVCRQFAHRVDLQLILALRQAVFAHQADYLLAFLDGPHERDHWFDVRKAHVLARSQQRLAL